MSDPGQHLPAGDIHLDCPIDIDKLFGSRVGLTAYTHADFDHAHQHCLDATADESHYTAEAKIDACVDKLLAAQALCLEDPAHDKKACERMEAEKRVLIGARMEECSKAYEQLGLVDKSVLAALSKVYPLANVRDTRPERARTYGDAINILMRAGKTRFDAGDHIFALTADQDVRPEACSPDSVADLAQLSSIIVPSRPQPMTDDSIAGMTGPNN